MATMDIFENAAGHDAAARTVGTGVWAELRRRFAAVMQCHAERRALVRLSRLDPRLVRDMGFDPMAVYRALEGSWDETHEDRMRGLKP